MIGELKSLRSVIIATIEQSKQQPLRCTIEAGLPHNVAGIKGCVAWLVALAGKAGRRVAAARREMSGKISL